MIPLVLFATALLVRLAVGVLFSGPAYPDSYYYVHVAQQLAAGNGFASDYLWNLADAGGSLPALAHLPVPANALWMPLAELVQLPLVSLLGGATFASGVTFALVGALAAPLTYWLGRDLGLGSRAALVGGLMVAVPAGLTPFVAQPDNFALLMVLGPLALWLCARGARGNTRAFVLGGLVVGLATLARLDGVLLAVPFLVVAARQWRSAAGFLGVLALVLAPWLVRQWAVFGSPVPATGTLWLTSYQQLFSISSPPSLEGWLAQGVVPILANHAGGLLSALGLFALLPLAVVLAPFAALGAWDRRRDPAFGPFFVYAVAVFLVVGVGFAVLVPHGTFLHAAAGLVPHAFLLVAVGVERAVRWVAARRPAWEPERAARMFGWSAAAIAVLAAALQTVNVTAEWRGARTVQEALVGALNAAPASDRFMAADPGAINYLTGRQGILTPADPLPVIEDAMRAYDVRWLILERDSIVPALAPVLAGEITPDWLSRPVATVAVPGLAVASTVPTYPLSYLGAVYAVCFDAADARCAR